MMGSFDRARISLHSPRPSRFGIRKSVITRSGDHSFINWIASSPSEATRTPYPWLVSVVLSTRVICGSSSTTRMFPLELASFMKSSLHLLGHDVHVNGRCVAKELMNDRKVKISTPTDLR